ncbi:MAG: hypothetical protein KJ604_20840, partial [Gammaproteobacteria bacterium]|nr:hypothetical protein [Gammaproteobacteria bacterium]
MTSVNSEKIRLAQNANRTWDKVSESAQLKTASLTIAKELLSGKFGKELQEKAKTEFPKDKFPSLYI